MGLPVVLLKLADQLIVTAQGRVVSLQCFRFVNEQKTVRSADPCPRGKNLGGLAQMREQESAEHQVWRARGKWGARNVVDFEMQRGRLQSFRIVYVSCRSI